MADVDVLTRPGPPPETLRHCVECAEPIAKEAKKCRHCGAYQRRHHRWVGPVVTMLSLVIAILSLAISSADSLYEMAFPKTPLFAALEELNDELTARLVVHNESSDSVVVENMKCFLKVTRDPTDRRYVDSVWINDSSSVIPPGSNVEVNVDWRGSAESEFELDDEVGAPLPYFESAERRWSSTCKCDPGRDLDEVVYVPNTSCRLYFRSSRQAGGYYDFRADVLNTFFEGMIERRAALAEDNEPNKDGGSLTHHPTGR